MLLISQRHLPLPNTKYNWIPQAEKSAKDRRSKMAGMDYSDWSHENLIKRVTQLEKELKDNTKRYSHTLPISFIPHNTYIY